MNMLLVTKRLLLLTATLTAIACGSAAEPVPLVGAATVTIETSTGSRTVHDVEAAFYLHSPGPTPSNREMFLALGTREMEPGAFSLELIQFLGDNQEIPSPGTFAPWEDALGGNPAMNAYVHLWDDTGMQQFGPVSTADYITISTASADRVTGSYSIALRNVGSSSSATVMSIHGTFDAKRIERYEDLPVVWW